MAAGGSGLCLGEKTEVVQEQGSCRSGSTLIHDMSSTTRSKTGQGVNQEAEAREGMEPAVMVGATEVAINLENMERARRAEMDDRMTGKGSNPQAITDDSEDGLT